MKLIITTLGENMEKQMNYADGIQVTTTNDLEVYRFDSFFDKEPETIYWIDNYIKKNDVVFDVGANIGVYSLYIAKTKVSGKIIAIEPFLENFVALTKNIRLNNFQNLIPLFIALSDRDSLTSFHVKDARVGASGSQIDNNINEKGVHYGELFRDYILTYKFDNLIKTFDLPFPNHIKVDVDGREKSILCGMKETLKSPHLKTLLFEVNSHDEKSYFISELNKYNFTSDNEVNKLENHSRIRRSKKLGNVAENIVFTRK